MNNQISVDFHCHTLYSTDSFASIKKIISAIRKQGLDRLVITDHHSIQGALLAKELAPDLIIVGEEIETREGGEVLAAFVKELIPAYLPYQEVVTRLREQNAFISLSHPYDFKRKGWPLEILTDLSGKVDAIEVFNARALTPDINQQAQMFAKQHNLPGTAGSDAHTVREVGRARVTLPEFNDADGLRQAIKEGTISGIVSSPMVRLVSIYAKRYRKLKGKIY